MYDIYTIKKGDNLTSIANRYNTTINDILKINNINENSVRIGDKILVPETSKMYFDYYTIKKGDTIYEISRKYNINPELLASLNGLDSNDYIYPDQTILIPKSNYSYYITKEGDTLEGVSNIFRIKKDKLVEQNNTIYLMEGQILVNKTR